MPKSDVGAKRILDNECRNFRKTKKALKDLFRLRGISKSGQKGIHAGLKQAIAGKKKI